LTSPAHQFNQRTIAEFRDNHGQVGGNFAGAPLLLLHTVGARSGQRRITPMMYLADGDRYLVFAAKAGSDRNPDWFWIRRLPAEDQPDDPGHRAQLSSRPSTWRGLAADHCSYLLGDRP
jgi:F420H(2)-dependent quinone reductase